MEFLKNRYRKNLKILRFYHGVSARELSLELGMNEQRITNIEAGTAGAIANATEMNQLAEYFNVSLEDMCHKVAILKFEYPKED